MKGELVSFAKEKEFIGKYHLGDCFPIEDYDFSNLEDHWYLWMCELQKWLRENHGIHINVDFGIGWGHQLIPVGWSGERFSEKFIDGRGWDTYEEALEEGLRQGLKLLK